jgi:Cu/Ag efflux protein CusF
MRLAFFATLLLTGSVATASSTAAQSKTLVGETNVSTATIEAIEQATRSVTLKEPDGTYTVLTAPPEMKRFSELKVGDKVTVRYYETVTVRLKAPDEKAVDTGTEGATRGTGAKPGLTVAQQRTITATITQLDRNVPSITFSGPNGWTYSSRVEDKAALAKVKVGDRVDITWTAAALVSIEPLPKGK